MQFKKRFQFRRISFRRRNVCEVQTARRQNLRHRIACRILHRCPFFRIGHAANGTAAQMGKPKPAGLMAGKHPHLQRISGQPPRLQPPHRAQRADDADRAVEIAAFRNRIDMRASRHYWRCRVAAGQTADDVPDRIHADLQPHFHHRIHDQPLGFPVRLRVGQARKPRFRLADPSHFFEHHFHPSLVQ